MTGKSKIEWTEATWNPIVGCAIVSPGCTNCYAMRMAARIERMGSAPHYAGLTETVNGNPVWTGKLARAPEHILLEPLKRQAPTTWFVNSMGDLFHEDCPDEWIDPVFAVMALCPQHTLQVLTKRSARMREYMVSTRAQLGRQTELRRAVHNIALAAGLDPESPQVLKARVRVSGAGPIGEPLPNVWLGVSAERQKEADERIPDLLATPAAVRFVSAEPLLGPIDFGALPSASGIGRHLDALSNAGAAFSDVPHKLDWIIVGGESGPGARPMQADWARSIRDQCQAAGVAFFFKQWGNHKPTSDANGPYMAPVARKADAGRLLDGREWNEMPHQSAEAA